MRKLFFVAFVCAALLVGAQAQEKKYADVVGDYEFDQEGQVMIVTFWVEDGKLWGAPEGQDSAELEPVEGKPLHFIVNTPDGATMEIEFVKDDSGKVAKCVVDMMGMAMEGVKIKK
jgi:hypothetical protein